ncbi:MAG: hypothetical protein U0U69_09325 [Acidimicrobiia bacterium]
MKVGTKVEVRSQFDRSWASGFEISEIIGGGTDGEDGPGARYKVRRESDGMVLPREFDWEEIRRERKGGMWWYR